MSFETAWPLRTGWNWSELLPSGGGRPWHWTSYKAPREKCGSHFPNHFFFLSQRLILLKKFRKWLIKSSQEEFWSFSSSSCSHRGTLSTQTFVSVAYLPEDLGKGKGGSTPALPQMILQPHSCWVHYLTFCFYGVPWACPLTQMLNFCPFLVSFFFSPFYFSH